ncbi:MAG TPA: hypothetical protein VIY52_34490 [Streptosporangiaceae bacterium]
MCDTWHTISEIGAANPTVVANPFVMGHFNTLYYRRALVSVRAMVDPNNDSDSLLTLLTDIAAHPGDLETTNPEMRLPRTDTIDPDKVLADIEGLKTVAATTKKYVNASPPRTPRALRCPGGSGAFLSADRAAAHWN